MVDMFQVPSAASYFPGKVETPRRAVGPEMFGGKAPAMGSWRLQPRVGAKGIVNSIKPEGKTTSNLSMNAMPVLDKTKSGGSVVP